MIQLRPSFRRGLIATPAIAVAVMMIGSFAVSCDDGDDRAPAPATAGATVEASPTPAPATPTPVSVDPDVGARLRYEGDTEGAIEVYAAIATQSDGEQRQDARVALGQLQFEAERYADAHVTLGSYLDDATPDEQASPAAFMRADALAQDGDIAGGIAAYERYIAGGQGALLPYARGERAELLARAGRIADAEAAAEEAILADTQQLVAPGLLFGMGRAFEDAGADLQALGWYQRAIDADVSAAAALSRRGAILRRLGDPAWVGAYASILKVAPGSAQAAGALDALDEAGVAVSSFERGFVYYRAFRNAEARAAFTDAVAMNDTAASATYYLGALAERLSEYDLAIEHYAAAHALNPAAATSDDAQWWRGRLLEVAGRYDEASAVYSALLVEYPASEFAADAAFHGGLALYRGGDAAAAVTAWAALAARSEEHERARALFWQARAEQQTGADAAVTLRSLAAESPDDFYALRAEVLLGDNDDTGKAPDLVSSPPDWAAIGAYLGAVTGDDPAAPTTAMTPVDDRLGAAEDLEAAGRHVQADSLFRAIVTDHEGDIFELYWIARRSDEAGRFSISSRAATTLLVALPANAGPPPVDLLRAAYPAAYGSLTLDAAKEQQIDPLLLMALMRQESFYDPRAGSSAGALGLTQVIAPTGEAIANDLGIDDFVLADLYRPRLSLRFGASYLSDQLDAFDGNAYQAIAAYNGGPGTSLNAIASAGDDIDLFAEDIEFEETRRYIRLVMEHYARYRQAYLDLDGPSLPE